MNFESTQRLLDVASNYVKTEYTTKGDKIIRNESYFVLSNGEKESCAGTAFCSAGLKNLLKKPIKHIEIKKFDSRIGTFVSNSL